MSCVCNDNQADPDQVPAHDTQTGIPLAWSLLRNRRLRGLKFRRQHVLHGFIVDFYCPALRLVLEPDGNAHDGATQAGYDAARTAWLTAAAYHVIRVRNKDLTRKRLGGKGGEDRGRGGQGVRTGRGESGGLGEKNTAPALASGRRALMWYRCG